MADTGVFDELHRMDQMNQTWYGSFSRNSTTTTSNNLKALKNMSQGVTTLIENRPMHLFANQMANEDRNRFMTLNLKKRKPIFKNYIMNNASILRKEVQLSRKEEYEEHER